MPTSAITKLGRGISVFASSLKTSITEGKKFSDVLKTKLGGSAQAASAMMGLATAGIGLAIGATVAIISAIDEYNRKEEEKRQKIMDNAKAVKEEVKNLNELIAKYKELRESGDVDADTRSEVRNIQEQITDLVGKQADNLDLVNGKLDNEIAKLREIALQKAKDAQDSYVAAYTSARTSSGKAEGSSGGSIAHPGFSGWDYIGGRDKDAEKILKDAGYNEMSAYLNGASLSLGGYFNNSLYIASIGDAAERANALKVMLDTLKNAADYDYTSSTLFATLQQQYEEYLKYGDKVSSIAKDLTNNAVLIASLETDNAGAVVNSVDSYNAYRDMVIQAASGSDTLKNAIDEGSISINDITVSVDDLMATNFPEWYNQVNKSANPESINNYTKSLSKLKDTLSGMQNMYGIIEDAQKDMDTQGGLSIGTIQKLAAATDDYMDYLTEENGVLRLNAEAFKKLADEKLKADMAEINLETESLEKQRAEIEKTIEEYKRLQTAYPPTSSQQEAMEWYGSYTVKINEANDALEDIDQSIADNQGLLSKYTTIFDSLQSVDLSNVTHGLDAITIAMDGMDNIVSSIDNYSDSMSTLASVQEALAKSFTLTLDKAKEFAAVYPELLNGATTSADGQIVLNEEVAKSFIEAKRAELDAEVQSQIAKLQANKVSLEAKKASAEAQLDLANQVASGEVEIENAKVKLLADAEQVLIQYLVDLGVDETEANKAASEAKAGNMQEYSRIVGEVATDNASNLAQSMADAANSTKDNVVNMVSSLDSLGRQAVQVASQIANVGKGVTTYNGQVTVGGGGINDSSFTSKYGDYSFKGVDQKSINVLDLALEEWKKNLTLDISGYTDAIGQIDGQISTLESLLKLPISDYKGGLGDSSSGSGGKGSKKEIDEYIAKINELSNVEQRLEDIRNKRSIAETKLGLSDNLSEQIALREEIIDLYKQEQDALHDTNEQRRSLIQTTVDELRSVGFNIKYNAESNELFVENMEHVNEITGKTTEETNALRKKYEDMINAVVSGNKDNVSGSELWLNILKDIRGEYNEIYQIQQQAKENAIKLLEYQLEDFDNNMDLSGMDKNIEEQVSIYNDIIEDAYKRVDELQKAGVDSLDFRVMELRDTIFGAQSSIKDLNKRFFDENIKMYDDYISQQNHMNNWGVDSEIDALKRKQAFIEDQYDQGLLAYKDFVNAMNNVAQQQYTAEVNRQKAYIDVILRL